MAAELLVVPVAAPAAAAVENLMPGVAQSQQAHSEDSVDVILEEFRRKKRDSLPTHLRWHVWKLALSSEGGPASPKSSSSRASDTIYFTLLDYKELCDKADAGAMNANDAEQIQKDLGRTGLQLDNEQQHSLGRLLRAFVVSKSLAPLAPDDVAEETLTVEASAPSYVQGMAPVAGLLLRESGFDEEEAFEMFSRLMSVHRLDALYDEGLSLVHDWQLAHEECMAQSMPRLVEKIGMPVRMFAGVFCPAWFMKLYVGCLPYPLVLAIVDVIICELNQTGIEIIKNISISLLEIMGPALQVDGLDAEGIQNALVNHGKIMNESCFVHEFRKHIERRPAHDLCNRWHVLASAYAGFVAGSAECWARSRDDVRVKQQQMHEEVDQWRQARDQNYIAGVAVGAIGGAASCGLATAVYFQLPTAMALLSSIVCSSTQAGGAQLAAASVPMNVLGVLCIADMRREAGGAAEALLEIGQDAWQAFESLTHSRAGLQCSESDGI